MVDAMINLIEGQKPLENNSSRYFALCDSCLWSATILKAQKEFKACPVCTSNTMSMIPLTIKESYSINISPKTGLDVSFYIEKNWPDFILNDNK